MVDDLSIRSAVDPNSYVKNQFYEIHGNTYDYSLVNYINAKTPIQIISPYQTFWQTPNKHLQGAGCSILAYQSNYRYTTYVEKGLRSKHCKNFKVYILKCYNDNETFYKIGKNFTTIEKRYHNKFHMPYNYEVLHEIIFNKTFEQGIKCCQLENQLHLDNKEFRYTPLIKFAGSKNECFLSLNGIQSYLHNL